MYENVSVIQQSKQLQTHNCCVNTLLLIPRSTLMMTLKEKPSYFLIIK